MPPTISPIPDKTVNETDNLTLACVAIGVPSPFVSWVKVCSGQRTNGSLLQLANISRSQAGEYRCEASNECGNAVETVNITVPCKLQRCHSCRGILRSRKFHYFKKSVKCRYELLNLTKYSSFSLRKQPSYRNATTGFSAKWRVSNKRRNSILVMRHYPDLGSASDWMKQIINQERALPRSR